MKQLLPFTRTNSLIYIGFYIWNASRKAFERMIIAIDTGASVTTISKQNLKLLGYVKSNKFTTITTASGPEKVYKHVIPRMKLGEVELNDVDVYAHDFPEDLYTDGVLGMNVLENFNFTVNFDTNIIELNPRKGTNPCGT